MSGNKADEQPTISERDLPNPQVIELLEEVLQISKRRVATGHVRVSLQTDVEDRVVSETLASRRVDVEHVAVGQTLAAGAAMPQSRIEDGVLIVPMVEELLVIEKRLVVTEELHIRIAHESETVEKRVKLRRQRAVVERLQPSNDSEPA